MLVAVAQVNGVGGEGLGMMYATVGGGVEEAVEVEKEYVAWEKEHVQARRKGGSQEGGDKPLDPDCCNGKTDLFQYLGGTSGAR